MITVMLTSILLGLVLFVPLAVMVIAAGALAQRLSNITSGSHHRRN